MDETWFSETYPRETDAKYKPLAGSTPVIQWFFKIFFENDELDLWIAHADKRYSNEKQVDANARSFHIRALCKFS